MARTRNKPVTLARTSIERKAANPAPEPDAEPLEVSIVQPTPRPIDESLKRGRLTYLQHAAAERYFSNLMRQDNPFGPRSVDFVRNIPRPKAAPHYYPNPKIVMLERANRAIRERLTPLHLQILLLVVRDEYPAAVAARKLGIPARNGIGLLRESLDLLAELFDQ